METVEIDGVMLRLSHAEDMKLNWIGNEDVMNQLIAAWRVINEDDIPLNPRILGKPGVGKTALAYTAAKKVNEKQVYIFQCTMDTRPDDLIIQPVIGQENNIEYHASPLVTAMIKGGICILDEANRMSEKSWASLAPLLDKRRYVESIAAGIKIPAHQDFRIVVTINEDTSVFEIPEYISSRLQPKVYLDFPNPQDEFEILKYNVPYAGKELLKYIVDFLQDAHIDDRPYSVRDGINIVRYYLKLVGFKKTNSEDKKKEVKDPQKSYIDFLEDRLEISTFEFAMRQILGDEAIGFLKKNNTVKNVDEFINKKDIAKNIWGSTSNKKKNYKDFDKYNDFFDDNIDYDEENEDDEYNDGDYEDAYDDYEEFDDNENSYSEDDYGDEFGGKDDESSYFNIDLEKNDKTDFDEDNEKYDRIDSNGFSPDELGLPKDLFKKKFSSDYKSDKDFIFFDDEEIKRDNSSRYYENDFDDSIENKNLDYIHDFHKRIQKNLEKLNKNNDFSEKKSSDRNQGNNDQEQTKTDSKNASKKKNVASSKRSSRTRKEASRKKTARKKSSKKN